MDGIASRTSQSDDGLPTGEEARRQLFGGWSRYQRIALPIIGLAIGIVAVVVLERLLGELSLDDVVAALEGIAASDIVLAVLFTAISFAAVAFYDIVAVETIAPGRIPKLLAGAVGAAGYAVSNALGFALLTGGALRYRIYAGEGIALSDIGRIIGTSWFAIWFAFAVMVAFGLVVDPTDAPFLDRLDPRIDVAIGLALLVAVALLVIWLARGERTLTIRGTSLRLPSSRGALTQIIAGIVDVCAAAATLYVLMPDSVATTPAVFAIVYVVATIVGIASHSPGGLGAFEATIIAGLGIGDDASAIAALLAYRAIYTLLPFLVAVLGILIVEVRARSANVSKGVRMAGRLFEPMVPPLAAGATFLGGIVLLVSGATPGTEDRLDVLVHILPLPFIELSHLAASFVGVAMLVLARGLARRLHRAWVGALLLFGLGALFSLAKGLDWEEATILVILSGVLVGFRASFYRRPIGSLTALSWGWLASVISIVVVSTWLGFFSYRDVDYSNQLFWQFELGGDAPRFLRASLFVALVTVGVVIHTIANRQGGRGRPHNEIPPEVPAIVAQARPTYAALALLGDKHFLFSSDRRGFVMYARAGGSLIALGEPIGPQEQMSELAWAFHDLADRAAARTVFYEVGAESLPLFLDMGLVALKLGEVARVELPTFTLDGPRRQPLRYADRRAAKDGLVFQVVAAAEVVAILPELRAVSDAWLEVKSGREKGFSLGYFDEDYMSHFDCAVMRRDGRIVAFANLWRGGDRDEVSIDLMRHTPDAPKIIMDALFAKLLLYGKEQGYRWFNLGAAPLSGLSDSRIASRWSRFGAFLYRRGRNLYHFDGLKAFKDKFDPVWTPHYLICPPGLDTARSLIDVTALISGGPLEFIPK